MYSSQECHFPSPTEHILWIDRILQGEHVGELLVLINQIQFRQDGGEVLETILAHSEHHLHHVLHSLVNLSLVQYSAKPLKDG